VWAALVDAATAAGAAAIVCGSHGHNAVVRAVIGSVASGLAHRASVPVLVVPSKAPQADGPIVIGYDFSDASARAIEACGRLMPGRRAVVAHAWRSRVRHTAAASALRYVPLARVRETMTDLDDILDGWETEDTDKGAVLARRAGLDASGIAIETRLSVPTALLDLADDRDAPVLAVGRRGRGAVTSALFETRESDGRIEVRLPAS
jgi:nucleotide-binding universal stress UspA family protein